MSTILLVTPVFRRFQMTKLMLEQRVETLSEAYKLGVTAQCFCIGDEENVKVAQKLGMMGLVRENVLGAK